MAKYQRGEGGRGRGGFERVDREELVGIYTQRQGREEMFFSDGHHR